VVLTCLLLEPGFHRNFRLQKLETGQPAFALFAAHEEKLDADETIQFVLVD
jgi:hypothetical protein